MSRRASARRAAARARLRARQGPPSWFLRAELGWSAYVASDATTDVMVALPPGLDLPEAEATAKLIQAARSALARWSLPAGPCLTRQRTEGVPGVRDHTLVTTTWTPEAVTCASGEVEETRELLRALVNDLEAGGARPAQGLQGHAMRMQLDLAGGQA